MDYTKTKESQMMNCSMEDCPGVYEPKSIVHTVRFQGHTIVIDNVPARVNLDTGEQLFAPATVEHLQRLIWKNKRPARIMQVPVYEYA